MVRLALELVLAAVGEQERVAQSGPRAAGLWVQAQDVYLSLGNPEQALRSARCAVEAATDDFKSRRNLAKLLLKNQRFDEALVQIRWCLLRYPENKELRDELGIAHAYGRRVILLAQSAEDIPFDIQRFRHVIYQTDDAGLATLRRGVRGALLELLG